MAKLSAVTEHALSIAAHAIMVKDIDSNVKGFSGLYEFWLKDQTPKDREIVATFLKLATQARKDFTTMLAKDMKDSNGRG